MFYAKTDHLNFVKQFKPKSSETYLNLDLSFLKGTKKRFMFSGVLYVIRYIKSKK